MTKNIRVRFAPSPTGALHMGNLRAALFNWLFAKKHDGRFVLRIEDTDTARSTKEAEDNILTDLAWAGMDIDEGPSVGGDYAPYRQSERSELYTKYLNQLIEEKKAYRCYCSVEELEAHKRERIRRSLMPAYSNKCRDLTPEDEEKYVKEGRDPVIRLRVKEGAVKLNDIVKGEISYDSSSLGGDFIVQRSNGEFVYNFTVVIDDALMQISHVIRGEDHLTNTFKQILLYEGLSLTPPQFAHCPLILGDDKKKLKKRFLTEAFAMFRRDGIIPEALLNYTALLGWSNKDKKEIFTTAELIEAFDLKNVSTSPSVFSYDKLKWVNGEHIKMMDDSIFAVALHDYLNQYHKDSLKSDCSINLGDISAERFREFSRLVKEGTDVLADVLTYIPMFLSENVTLSDDAAKALKSDGAIDVIKSFAKRLEAVPELNHESYDNILNEIKSELKVKGKALFMPIRVAVSGSTKGPHMDDLCTFLQKGLVTKRVLCVINNM
ncbi:glutamate--tRNA ligase [Thermodesulfobacteriota bacterium]